ncbi:MAG TPA: hypothetical protein PLO51_05385 [Candidatus Micrarchaeota archaeon]|nr:hypothetical protein [Candidatus Micrarchaeota archaeon]
MTNDEFWSKISDLHSSHDSLKSHIMHNLGISGSISPERVHDDSLFLLSLSNAIADVLKHPSGQAQEKAQVMESYHRIVDAAKALSENLYSMDLQQNATDASHDFATNLERLEYLINDSSVNAIANGGSMEPKRLEANARILLQLEARFYGIRRRLYSQPSSNGLSAPTLATFLKVQKNVKSIAALIERMPDEKPALLLPPAVAGALDQLMPDNFERFKVALVKSLIQLVSGKVLIDRKHVTVKSTHNGTRKSFRMDDNARHALLDLFESTFVKDSLSEVLAGSDGTVVAQFEVAYEGAEPKSIHLNIGSRRHEGNTITFSPVSMYLPAGQISAISSLDFENENS